MLILRDLHAGPARYVDLQRGLPGLASNLLTDRLKLLEDQGLVEKTTGPYDVTLYRLTERGALTRPAIEELGKLGLALGLLPREETERPRSVRFMAVGLQAILSTALPAAEPFVVGLRLDDEWFTVEVESERISVTYEPPPPGTPELEASYELLRDVCSYGDDPGRLRTEIAVVSGPPEALDRFCDLLERALATVRSA